MFRKETAAEILLETMLHYQEKGFYRLHDFVVMPDHFHVILTPGEETALEKAVQAIKGGSSYRIGRALNSKFPVWQPGFHEHWIRSDGDYRTRKRYIEVNPVSARLTNSPQAYPYGSASGRFKLYPVELTSGAKARIELRTSSAGLKPRPAKYPQTFKS